MANDPVSGTVLRSPPGPAEPVSRQLDPCGDGAWGHLGAGVRKLRSPPAVGLGDPLYGCVAADCTHPGSRRRVTRSVIARSRIGPKPPRSPSRPTAGTPGLLSANSL